MGGVASAIGGGGGGLLAGGGGGGGIGGLIGGITGQTAGIEAQAQAAQGAARRRLQALAQTRELTRREGEEAIREAAPSVLELQAIEGSIRGQERNIARQERLIQEIDPVILEASQQALALLRGEEAQSLGPLRRERQNQRQKLVNQLRSQLGPGAETSSAGIQALNRFDQDTSLGLAQAQQTGLASLGQTAGTFRAAGPQLGAQFATLGGLGQLRGGINQRQADVRLRALQPRLQAGLGVAGASGAEFVGQQIRGAGQVQLGQQGLQFFSQLAGAGLSAAAGGGA